jgi:hypothetical protein
MPDFSLVPGVTALSVNLVFIVFYSVVMSQCRRDAEQQYIQLGIQKV